VTDRCVLAYSGGLDTSVAIGWLKDKYGAEVIAMAVDVGQGVDEDLLHARGEACGAAEVIVVDAREEFARDYIVPAIKANAIYGLGYPLFTALGRPLIAKLAVDYARQTGCDTIAHGCTGKGNDQVRIEGTVTTLDPAMKIIAPVRSWARSSPNSIAFAASAAACRLARTSADTRSARKRATASCEARVRSSRARRETLIALHPAPRSGSTATGTRISSARVPMRIGTTVPW